jgi:uncharacterized membrane protein
MSDAHEPPVGGQQPPGGPPPGGPPPGQAPGGPPGGPPPGQPPGGPQGGPPPGQPPGSYPPASQPPAGGPPAAGPPTGFDQEPYSIGNAFSYGWLKFQQNVGPILIAVLAYVLALAVLSFIWFTITGLFFGGGSEAQMERFLAGESSRFFSFGALVAFGLQSLVGFIGGVIIQAAVTQAALLLTRGQPIEVKTLFSFGNLPQLLLGALIVGVLSGIGTILCYIPGLIVLFFTQFYVHFLLDKGLSALDAIKASFAFVNQHVGTLIGFYLASLVALFVGALLCGIGLLVAFPVVVIAQAYTFRRLLGEPVAA